VRFLQTIRQDEWPSISRPHQTLHTSPSGGAATGDEGALQPKVDVDWVNIIDIFGHEPDAFIWYRVIRQLGSNLLAANDDGE
jgi:hypothetical protein